MSLARRILAARRVERSDFRAHVASWDLGAGLVLYADSGGFPHAPKRIDWRLETSPCSLGEYISRDQALHLLRHLALRGEG